MEPPDATGVGGGHLRALCLQVGPIALMGGPIVRGEAVATAC